MILVIMSATNEIFVILDHFLLFHAPKNPKNENFQKMKNTPEDIIILPKIMLICYTVLEICCMTDVILIFYFGLIFALLPCQQPKKMKIKNWWKKRWKKLHVEVVAPPKNYYKRFSLLNVLIISFLISYFSFRFYSTWWCQNIAKHFIL